jgi:hypothetical protein
MLYSLEIIRIETTRCKILHTCVHATPVVLEILCIFVFAFRCTVARSSLHHCCSRSAFAHGKEPVSLKVLCTFSNVLRCGYHCHYYTTATLPYPLQEPYTKYLMTYSSFVNVLILTTLQRNTATLA